MIILQSNQKINTSFKFNKNFSKKSKLQKRYNDIVFSFDLSKITCHNCDHSKWSFHASYNRSLNFFGQKVLIKIVRVICNACGVTHAILIDEIIPFVSYFHSSIISIVFDEDEILGAEESIYYKDKLKFIKDYTYETLCLFFSRNIPCLFFST